MSSLPAAHADRRWHRVLSSLQRGGFAARYLHRACRVRGEYRGVGARLQVSACGNLGPGPGSRIGSGRARTRCGGYDGPPNPGSDRSRTPSPSPAARARLQSCGHPGAGDFQEVEMSAGHEPLGARTRYAHADPPGTPATSQQCPRRISLQHEIGGDHLASRRRRDHRQHARRSGTLPAPRGCEECPWRVRGPHGLN